MKLTIGQTLRELRRKKGVSQEKLAERLGVSFQAVSKWENELCLPDVTLFPVIAEYFGVSTDALFGVDRSERERRIEEIVERACTCRAMEPGTAEEILREGLSRYPGDPVLLNNLLYTMRASERRGEVVRLCRALIENSGDYDDVRYDAARILAETYAAMGEQALAREAVEQIPEIYFSKLEVAAENLKGEEGREAALRQRNLAADCLIRMLLRLAAFNRENGANTAAVNNENQAQRLLEFIGDYRYAFGDGKQTLRDIYGRDAQA